MCGAKYFGTKCNIVLYVFFFFQAEDGIRDLTVTGVQTCALPICDGVGHGRPLVGTVALDAREPQRQPAGILTARLDVVRSEERRVGKECRSRWSPYH